MTIHNITATYDAPALPAPAALVVFTDKRTGNAVALSTDVELAAGLVLPHMLADYTVHEGVGLIDGPRPQIGQPWPPVP